MAGNLVSMSDQFQGLPMDSLIGGPLTAATKAQVTLAQSTADFINTVGFDPARDNDGNLVPGRGSVRYVEFEFMRPVEKQFAASDAVAAAGGQPAKPAMPARTETHNELVLLKVPMLSIVPVPNLQVDRVEVTFDMEVSSSDEHKDSKDLEVGWDVKIGAKFGPITIDARITGKVATHQENTRKSDNSAKYHVSVLATNHGMPEGLQRVWDIMDRSVRPVTKEIGIAPEAKSTMVAAA